MRDPWAMGWSLQNSKRQFDSVIARQILGSDMNITLGFEPGRGGFDSHLPYQNF